MKLRVSFDFDGTLEHLPKQKYAKELIERGVEVWIVTSRFEDTESYMRYFGQTIPARNHYNADLYEVADSVGIPRDRIIFTNMENKWPIVKAKAFVWHLDDDWTENRLILNNAKIKAIDAHTSSWKGKCERILKKAADE